MNRKKKQFLRPQYKIAVKKRVGKSGSFRGSNNFQTAYLESIFA